MRFSTLPATFDFRDIHQWSPQYAPALTNYMMVHIATSMAPETAYQTVGVSCFTLNTTKVEARRLLQHESSHMGTPPSCRRVNLQRPLEY